MKTSAVHLAALALAAVSARGAAAQRPVKPTPFVAETVFTVVGGPFRVVRSHMAPPYGPDNLAVTRAPLPGEAGDTLTTFYAEPTNDVVAHEAGHMLDFRQGAPELLAVVGSRSSEYRGGDWIARSLRVNWDEYVAEAFGRALMSGRRGFADSTEVERRTPGAIQVIRWLRTREPFARPTTAAAALPAGRAP